MKSLKHISLLLLAAVLLASCAGDHRRALPAGCRAVASIDAKAPAAAGLVKPLQSLLGLDGMESMGLDATERIYAFIAPDGNLGLAAKVADGGDVEKAMRSLAAKAGARDLGERQGCHFYAVAGRAVAGWTSDALLVMGPVTPSAEGEAMQTMARLLRQDADESLMAEQLWEHLDTMSAPVALIAGAAALPERLRPLAMLGMPKGADASRCLIAASVAIDSVLTITAQPFSPDPRSQEALDKAYAALRPVAGRYAGPTAGAAVAIHMNVDGRQLLPLLTDREEIGAMLAGANQAIDLNAILRSADGDITIACRDVSDTPDIALAAQLSNTAFLGDIGYWQSSLPKGYSLTPWATRLYRLTGPATDFFFGVTTGAKPEFYSGRTPEEAERMLSPGATAAPFAGSRLAVVVNLPAVLASSGAAAIASALGMKKIIYTVR